MRSARMGRAAVRPTGEPTPPGLNLAGGVVAVVAAGLVAAAVPASSPGLRFAMVPLAVAGFAAATGDELALAGVVPLGWLVTNGFLENRAGELSWHPAADLPLIMILVVVAAVGLAVGDGYRQVRAARVRRRAEAELAQMTVDIEDSEEKHGNWPACC